MSIKQQAIKGVKWTSISTFGRAFIQLLQLSIIAHYLTAEVIGLFALVQVCLAFFQLFSGVAIGNAIVQKKQVCSRHLSELFLINIAITIVLTTVIYLCAPLLSQLFEQSNFQQYIEFVAIIFFITALSKIHLALLQKQLAFELIAKIELISAIIAFIAVIVLIYKGLTLEALLYGYLLSAVLQSTLYWLNSSFRPKICKIQSWQEIKHYLTFGLNQTGSSTINYFNSQFDIIIIGKLLGPEVLGGYSLARQFCFRPAMAINPVFTRVAFPIMSKLQESKRLSSVYCKLTHVLALLNFPLYIALFALAEPIVQLVFGEHWLHIVPLFRLMACWCMLRSIINPAGALLMAIGKVSLALKWNVFLLCIFPLAIYVGTFYGIYGVVLSMLAMQFLLLPCAWYLLMNQTINISGFAFIRTLISPVLTAILAGTTAWVTLQVSSTFLYWQQLGFGLFIGIVSYCIIAYKTNVFFQNLCKGKVSFD